MSCNTEIEPCSYCQECDDCNPPSEATPIEAPVYVQTGCPAMSSFKCSEYTGNGNVCLNIVKGDTGDQIIDKIAAAVCDFIAGDQYVKASSLDTTRGYLADKIKAKVNSPISVTKKNGSANEFLEIDVDVDSIISQIVIPDDKFAKVSSTDSTAGYLSDKILESTYIKVIKTNPNSNEALSLSLDRTALVNSLNIVPDTYKLKISAADTTADYLSSKILPGTSSGIVLTRNGTGSNETITISINLTTLHDLLGLDNINVPLVITSPNSTVNISQSGNANHTVTLDAKISSTTGNQLTRDSTNGLFVPTPVFVETAITANDSSTILFTAQGTSNHTISASVKLSNASDNLLTNNSGLYVQNKINGTTTHLAKFNTGTSIADSIITDSGAGIGIGTAAEANYRAKIAGNIKYVGKSVSPPQTLSYAATTIWNLDLGDNAILTMTGNTTLSITNLAPGTCGLITIMQDTTGNRIITVPSGTASGGLASITLSTAANAVDILGFYYDGINIRWRKDKNHF